MRIARFVRGDARPQYAFVQKDQNDGRDYLVALNGYPFSSEQVEPTGERYPLFKEGDYVWRWVVDENLNTSREAVPGGTEAWFWVTGMPADSYVRYALDTAAAEASHVAERLPELAFDRNGWVASARWPGMDEPLFIEGLADFMVVRLNDMDRWSQGDIYIHMDDAQRAARFGAITETDWARPKGKARVRETPYSWIV